MKPSFCAARFTVWYYPVFSFKTGVVFAYQKAGCKLLSPIPETHSGR
jgi:hypothetical protein